MLVEDSVTHHVSGFRRVQKSQTGIKSPITPYTYSHSHQVQSTVMGYNLYAVEGYSMLYPPIVAVLSMPVASIRA